MCKCYAFLVYPLCASRMTQPVACVIVIVIAISFLQRHHWQWFIANARAIFCCCVDLSIITSHHHKCYSLGTYLENIRRTKCRIEKAHAEQKKHMFYVLSTKAPCINVNICGDFPVFQCLHGVWLIFSGWRQWQWQRQRQPRLLLWCYSLPVLLMLLLLLL